MDSVGENCIASLFIYIRLFPVSGIVVGHLYVANFKTAVTTHLFHVADEVLELLVVYACEIYFVGCACLE